jgi:3-ketoacyl-CoA synthase
MLCPARRPGGAKVLDGVQSAMRLAEPDLAPSRQVLYDYGNVSSSSTWYGLACIESLRGVAKGDKVVQIGVGSGVKVGAGLLLEVQVLPWLCQSMHVCC